MSPEPTPASRYRQSLLRHVARPSEASLSDAYELGRMAMAAGHGVLDLLAVHHEALRAALEAEVAPAGDVMERAMAFLSDALSPFEMVHRGFDEATTERRQLSQEFRSLVENAPLGIARCGLDGRLLSANPALADLLGYPSPAALLAANIGPALLADALDAFGAAGETPVAIEVPWSRRDGRSILVHLTGRTLTDGSGERRLEIMCEDVSARHSLEMQLREAQKLEAIGRLAAGVAHDFNNFITGILMCAHILRRGMPAGDPLRRHVDDIETSARTAGMVTQQLLAFGRQQVREPRLVRPDQVAEQVHNLLDRLLEEDISLELRVAGAGGMVRMDPGQLEQVLMNLVLNARDAMPDGGKVQIVITDVDVPERAPAGSRPPPGRYVSIAVRDEGVGIDSETKARIFEPFFTTKRDGQGTGLGLSTVYGIVSQNDGHLTVQSTVGSGSTFTLYLPRQAAVEDAPVDVRAPSIPAGQARVLLVEDDATIRHALGAVLEGAGYAVLALGSGDAAAALLARDAAFDLLVTDVMMPGVNGVAVAQRYRERCAQGRVLFMSGHADDPLRAEGIRPEVDTLLRKPFAPEVLVDRVGELLGVPGRT
jgi:PAS domain S-box-containing protein